MVLVNILYSFIYCWCTVLIVVMFCLYACSGMCVVVRVDRVQTVRRTSGTRTHMRSSRTSSSSRTKASIAWAYLDVLFII
jgi:hypothetical protein